MDEITNEVRLQEWREIIHAWSKSGMTKKDWCEENDVPLRQFYYWQRKVREDAYDELQASEASFPAVQNPSDVYPAFVELSTVKTVSQKTVFQADAVIKIGSVTIELSNSASHLLLSQIRELVKGVI